jgi:hypothetical protein
MENDDSVDLRELKSLSLELLYIEEKNDAHSPFIAGLIGTCISLVAMEKTEQEGALMSFMRPEFPRSL